MAGILIIQALVHGCATKLASTSLYGVRIPASLVFYCARDMMLFKPGYASLELVALAKQKKEKRQVN